MLGIKWWQWTGHYPSHEQLNLQHFGVLSNLLIVLDLKTKVLRLLAFRLSVCDYKWTLLKLNFLFLTLSLWRKEHTPVKSPLTTWITSPKLLRQTREGPAVPSSTYQGYFSQENEFLDRCSNKVSTNTEKLPFPFEKSSVLFGCHWNNYRLWWSFPSLPFPLML